jgi:hypothetical protein
MKKNLLDQLTPHGLQALIHGEVLGIRVPNFISAQDCYRIASTVTISPHFRFDGPGFRGLGPGSFALPTAERDYFSSANLIDHILARPYEALESALGTLQRPLYDDVRRMRPLTARRYDDKFVAAPHQDMDQGKYPWAQHSQLGISLCIVTPESGGAIRLWDHAYGPAEYAERKLPDGFELDESLIVPHDAAIESGVGELLILNARQIHAIDRITKGARISVSGFLAADGSDFLIWS